MSTQLSGPPNVPDQGLWRWLQNLWQIVTQLANMNYVVIAPATGFSYQIPVKVDLLIVDAGATLASGTVILPGSPKDGQVCGITSRYNITALTVSAASGQTVTNPPTSLLVSTTAPFSYEFVYNASRSLWYRKQ
jgi:hypothetical protein